MYYCSKGVDFLGYTIESKFQIRNPQNSDLLRYVCYDDDDDELHYKTFTFQTCINLTLSEPMEEDALLSFMRSNTVYCNIFSVGVFFRVLFDRFSSLLKNFLVGFYAHAYSIT
jgi:hypothetical protein